MLTTQQQQQQEHLQHIRKTLEEKAKGFDNAKERSVAFVRSRAQDLRNLVNVAEGNILRDIEETYECNAFAAALYEMDNDSAGSLSASNFKELEGVSGRSVPVLSGPSKKDFGCAEEGILRLMGCLATSSHHRYQRVEGKALSFEDVEVSWDASPDAVKCVVEMRSSKEGAFRRAYEGTALTYTATGLEPGTKYLFRVGFVLSGNGVCTVGEWSEAIEVTTQQIPAPQFLFAKALSESEVSLSWNRISVPPTKRVEYHVVLQQEGSANNNNNNNAQEVYVGSNTEFTASGLQPETMYAACVKASCGAHSSSWSQVVRAETKVAAPKDFTAKAGSWDIVGLSWRPVVSRSGDAVRYVVGMKSGADRKYREMYNGTDTSLTGSRLQHDTEYMFRVRTLCENRASNWSEAAACRTQKISVPTSLAVRATSWDEVEVSWKPVVSKSGKAVRYVVVMKKEGGINGDSGNGGNGGNGENATGSRFTEVYNGAETRFTKNTGLQQDTEYSFCVCASSDKKNGEWSSAVKAKTQKIPAPRHSQQRQWHAMLLTCCGAQWSQKERRVSSTLWT